MRALISALLIAVLPGSALALQSSTNRADGGVTLRANVSTGVVVDPGDPVSFQYQSVRDGAVLVFDIDTQGNVSLLTDEPVTVRAHDAQPLPNDNSELFAEGQPGVEFVFAVAVDDPGAFDADAISALKDDSRRINGDPFVAANMITAEVIRNIAQQTVFMGYTYFYVSNRVDYPCYLCGTCDGTAKNECSGYHVAQNFDRAVSLVYPLARGYDMVDVSANTADSTDENVAMPDKQDEVSFYPYGTDIHYADPVAVNSWYDWGYYDPYYYYYPYNYPYCGYPYGYGFTVGIGWGWGWGGYHCGGCYNPYYGCGGYYGGGYYPGNGYNSGNVVKYKSQYKGNYQTANTLTGNRMYAMKRDGNLQVASKGTRMWSNPVSYRSKVTSTSYPMTSSHRVKTSITGSRGVVSTAWSNGRRNYGGYAYHSRSSDTYKGTGGGRTAMQRGGYSRSAAMPYGSGGTRMKSGYSGSNSAQGTWRPSYTGGGQSGGSRGNSGYSGSRPSGGSFKGGTGGGWGGSRGFSGGGAMKGGGAHGGGGRGK